MSDRDYEGSRDHAEWFRTQDRQYQSGETASDSADPALAQSLTALSLATPLDNLFRETAHTILTKQMDYGPRAVAEAPFGVLEGIVTRISDKFQRAVSLIGSGEDAQNESLEDTFMDLIGYSAIAMLCMRGQWPGVAEGGYKK